MYQLYADTIADFHPCPECSPKFYCATASRRDGVQYFYSESDIDRTFEKEICGQGRYPKVLAGVMGDSFYMAKFTNLKDLEVFRDYVNRKNMPESNNRSASSMFNKEGNANENICDTHIDGA